MTRAKTDNGIVPPLLPLEAAAAAIQTTTITIRTLQVGKKQMTQSAFRQLPEADLVDQDEVVLNGVPWGWVNYRWGDVDARMTNFIFQKGARIYRCAFHVRDSATFPWHEDCRPESVEFDGLRSCYRQEIRAYHCARILEGWGPGEMTDHHGTKRTSWAGAYRYAPLAFNEWVADLPSGHSEKFLAKTPDGVAFYLDINRLRERPQDESGLDRYPDAAESVRRNNEWLRQHQQGLRDWLTNEVVRLTGKPLSSAEIRSRLDEVERQAEDYCRRWDALMAQLRTVEQLFIAV